MEGVTGMWKDEGMTDGSGRRLGTGDADKSISPHEHDGPIQGCLRRQASQTKSQEGYDRTSRMCPRAPKAGKKAKQKGSCLVLRRALAESFEVLGNGLSGSGLKGFAVSALRPNMEPAPDELPKVPCTSVVLCSGSDALWRLHLVTTWVERKENFRLGQRRG